MAKNKLYTCEKYQIISNRDRNVNLNILQKALKFFRLEITLIR